MATTDADTERKRVQTYVPAYQKAEWQRHARELDMSLSEFLRSMVQAGRRGFEGGKSARQNEEPSGNPSSTPEPQGSDLERVLLSILSESEGVEWDELTEDFEERLHETLQELKDDDLVRHSGRDGGYVLE